MKIRVEKPTPTGAADFAGHPGGDKEPSLFDAAETCGLLRGNVRAMTAAGEVTAVGAGGKVTFPAGLHRTWEVRSAVRKHDRLG